MARLRIPPLLSFVAGVALGAVLASTATLHLLSDPRVHQKPEGINTCICPQPELGTLAHDETATTPPPVATSTLPLAQLTSNPTPFAKYDQANVNHTKGANSSKRRSLLVAVMTSEQGLRRASSVYASWAADASEVIFFVGHNCCTRGVDTYDLPLIRLNGVPDEPSASFEKTSAVLKYIKNNSLERHRWVLSVTDDTYVNLRMMDELLSSYNPLLPFYIGNLRASAGHCGGDAGMILSVPTVELLVPRLDQCDSTTSGPGDEVLGRCIKATAGINCTQLHSTFIKRPGTSPSTPLLPILLSDRMYHNAVTVYNVMETEDMILLHWYHQREEYLHLKERIDRIGDRIDFLCLELLIEDCRPIPMTPPCPQQGSITSVLPDLPPPPPSSSPRTIEDMVSWDFFDKGALYNDRSAYPSHAFRVMEPRKHEMKALNTEVAKEASRLYGKPLRFRKIIGGYTRYSPLVGIEYVVDAMFLDRSTMNSHIHLRVSLVRPLAPNYVAREESSDTTTTINFIVPVSNVDSRFAGFLDMYENIALKNQEAARLIVVTYGEEGVAFVNKVMQPYLERNAGMRSAVVMGQGTFSRAQAIHLGMSQLQDAELAFLCDVDMEIKNHFFNRCRRNPVRGKRVFFPEFFKMYNLDFVNRHKKDGAPPRDSIIRQYGHWAAYSYGMVCVYKSDYVAVGGMNTDIVGWGDEDVEFYERVLGKGLEVVRAPDTGLSHRWHEKECPASLPPTQHQHCLSSRAENLADRMELANYIFELQQNSSCTT